MPALPNLAESSELEVRLRRTFSSDEQDWVESVLAEASDVIRAESGRDWVLADDPTVLDAPPIVRTITLRVAARAIQNPDGYSAETAGDYSYQRNGVTADGSLFLTAWERKMLMRAAGKSGLWTQPLTRSEPPDHTRWMEDSFGFELFPVDDNSWP